MSDQSKDRTPPEFEQIHPAKIEISARAQESAAEQSTGAQRTGRRPWMLASLSLALVLALLVFWVLPEKVSRPEVTVPAAPVKAPVTEVAPWQEAQLAKERKAAQEELEQLLDLQFALEEAKVLLWAEAEFTQALAWAKEGDEQYRQQSFDRATELYAQARALMQELQAQQPMRLAQILDAGFAAIKQGDAPAAQAAFERAQQIDPFNDKAVQGLARAATLEQVRNLVARAEQALSEGALRPALAALQQALALDAEAEMAQKLLPEVEGRLQDAQFTDAMSQGFKALEKADYPAARSAFKKALLYRPGAKEPLAGLEEVEQRIAQTAIYQHRQQAENLITQERWADALAEYEAVLKLDPSVIFAQQGRKQTADRAKLDRLLQEQIDKAERLTEEAVYQEAGALLRVAGTVVPPGARLSAQIEQLQKLMQAVKAPVVVEVVSDNQTQITLFKTGLLGNFERQQLSLLPGRYVFVGRRDGFRDVRRELVVAANAQPISINIECTEPI